MQFEAGRLRLQVMTKHIDLEETPDQHQEHATDERVGRNSERGAGLPDSAQVHRGEHNDRDHREYHLVLGYERHGRADVGHRRSHRHGHREHVVDQQRTGHRQPGGGPQVSGDHLVITAAGGIGVHVLPVGGHHHEHHERHRHTDPGRHRVGRQTCDRQHQEDLLGGVGHRRHGVGGEHRQGDALGQQGVGQLVAAERLPDQYPAQAAGKLGHESQG